MCGLLRLPVLFCLLLLATTAFSDETHQHGPMSGKVGTVKFETSCDKSVQPAFETSVAMLHSFWYDEAEKSFAEVAKRDPECAMAYWGMAMSAFHPLWAPPSPQEFDRGAAAASKARAAKKQTPRE